MKVPVALSDAFKEPFEQLIGSFIQSRGLIGSPEELRSQRFLSRSILPHIEKLSSLFNRAEEDQAAALAPYWKESSNPENLRLAYFLYFMPSNLFRVASVWSELSRLGFKWPESRPLRAIELGAGPASGACGIAAAEHFVGVGLPKEGSWALLEQDKSVLELGCSWAEKLFTSDLYGGASREWSVRGFHRKLDFEKELLPRSAPRFNLWLMSFFLNELKLDEAQLAQRLVRSWEDHLEKDGLILMIEPALKLQSRRLLSLRKELLETKSFQAGEFQILLPCLGHQACGALANPQDWCHEEVSWWRPPYFRILDQLAKLDRKTLPFSYLVIARGSKTREELLPALSTQAGRFRLVSPAHSEGRDFEFFICGQDGKRRARYRPTQSEEPGRGDILQGAQVRGGMESTRVEKIARLT